METPITAESKLSEILARYPSAGPIFFQAGRAFVAKPSDLYAQYPGLTLAQYASQNGLDAGALVSRVRAEAESAEAARGLAPRDDDAPSRRRTALTLGYTSSYRDREDSGEGGRPVVSVQSAHGPE